MAAIRKNAKTKNPATAPINTQGADANSGDKTNLQASFSRAPDSKKNTKEILKNLSQANLKEVKSVGSGNSINLLPPDMAPKEAYLKASLILNRISSIGAVVFIVFVLGVLGGFFYLNNKRSSLVEENKSLQSQISALSQTQQSLLYAKDRLGKLNKIFATTDTSDEISTLESALKSADGLASVTKAELDPNKSAITFSVPGSENMTRLLSEFITSGEYKKITLSSFNYIDEIGYSFELVFIK